MDCFSGIHRLPKKAPPSAITLGNFDGMHLGHQALINKCTQIAKENGWQSIALTFEPYPEEYFLKNTVSPFLRLMTLREKYTYLKHNNALSTLVVLPFQASLAAMQPVDFLAIIKQLGARAIIVGEDCKFGHKRSGNTALLEKYAKEYGYTVHILPDKKCSEGIRISSSRLREMLSHYQLEKASNLLGRPYTHYAKIVQGRKMGRQLGCPTANFYLRHPSILQGVFAVKVVLSGCSKILHGVASIGNQPMYPQAHPALEVHLFAFSETIYGRYGEVEFCHYIRPLRFYKSIELLCAEIKKDILCAQKYFQQSF